MVAVAVRVARWLAGLEEQPSMATQQTPTEQLGLTVHPVLVVLALMAARAAALEAQQEPPQVAAEQALMSALGVLAQMDKHDLLGLK